MSQPDSQDSVGTQEVYSQGTFEEIWQTLNRTFSNTDKLLQGVLTEEIPQTIEYLDQVNNQPPSDNIEITYKKRTVRNSYLPNQICDSHVELDPNTLAPRTSDQNGHHPLTNGIGHITSPFNIPSGHLEPIHLAPILANTNYPGVNEFSISFEPNSEPITKATPWVYQAEHHKLFVKMQCVCPILFNFHGDPPPGCVIRGVLMYRKPESYKDIVIRCPNHRNTCKDGHPYQDHVMRCENALTRYEVCPSTGRLSVVIPIQAANIVVGEGYFKELFKFTCFNSCVGGMNRRPTNLLFRLECGGVIYARAVVEIRICASPGRDCNEKDSAAAMKTTKENDRRSANEPSSTSDITPMAMTISSSLQPSSSTSPTSCYPHRASVLMSARRDVSCVVQEPFPFTNVHMAQRKRPCMAKDGLVFSQEKRTCFADSTDDEEFTLKIRGRQRYQMLQKINEGLELLDGVGIRPLGSNEQRSTQNQLNGSSPEFTRIKPKEKPTTVKRENEENTQCNNSQDTTPQSSQEIPLQNLSQLSRTSSNASSMSSSLQAPQEFSQFQVTLKRTLSLEKSPRSRAGPQ